MHASTRLSISAWRISRPPDAPTAARTANSGNRSAVRANTRLPTLAHATIQTSDAESASSTRSRRDCAGTRSSRSIMTAAP
jgi:hypothetical protein